MAKNYMAILNLEESENDIRSLTAFRPIATIPFAGRYRVIDFILSNIVNANITSVGVFISKNTRSLVDHISTGKPWDLNRKIGGLFMFDHSLIGYKNYDVKMFGDNMEFLQKSATQDVIIASSYMICNIDLKEVIAQHEKSGNDITIVYNNTGNADREFLNCATLNLDADGHVVGVSKNIGILKNANICMEIFVMKKSILMNLIYRAVRAGDHTNFNSFLYSNLHLFATGTYRFDGSVKCINSVQAYYNANMDILNNEVRSELFTQNGIIYTKIKDSPPALYGQNCQTDNCVIADGSRIDGSVKNCIISRFVRIEEGAVLENCIILQGASVLAGARLSNVIVEKGVSISQNTQIVGTSDFPIVIERKNYNNIFDNAI